MIYPCEMSIAESEHLGIEIAKSKRKIFEFQRNLTMTFIYWELKCSRDNDPTN